MSKSKFIIEEVTDPDEIASAQNQDERHRKNSEWLASHWDDVLPQARGKFVAVAGQEGDIHCRDTRGSLVLGGNHTSGR